ncbi:hypothetical protein Mal48_03510 [Thalassoglobus polymorphus]|uniref:Uncharacterized protein n=2 Tax=Thalassoglobus polymorphus TaxID=2527994 RepID=A0A517QHM4_9PLAN|nr:hypothetical protein Mal48_03510 [Thalassoglobus polymorphus]
MDLIIRCRFVENPPSPYDPFLMKSFQDLVQSRRQWIDENLTPWCKVASRKDLLLAEHEWQDLAGRPAPEMTLWKWAWERFPVLSQEGFHGIDETNPVVVTCQDGRIGQGYPDAGRSEGGLLFLIGEAGEVVGPFAIDEISTIESAK